MRRLQRSALLLGASALLLAGCNGDRCLSDDVDCIADHLVLMQPVNDGAAIPLVLVDKAALEALIPPPACNGTLCAGKCVSLDVDPKNCGSCGKSCAFGEVCAEGACACPAGQSLCDGACVDLQSDFQNCGACSHRCEFGTGSSSSSSSSSSTSSSSSSSSGAGGAGGMSAGSGGAGGAGGGSVVPGGYCSAGNCISGCAPSQDACGLSCVDLQSDANHCGFCNVACKLGESCEAGKCTCTAPTSACGCVDAATDRLNCGGCGVVCSPAQSCDAGVCWPPLPDLDDPLAITGAPLPIAYVDPSALRPFDLDWRDPNACQPAFCGQVCTDDKCSSRFVCTAATPGGESGTFRSFLGFLLEPRSQSSVFTLDLVPVSAPGCPSDLLDRLAAGDLGEARAGAGARVPIKLTAPSAADTSELRCTAPSALCACPVRACSTSLRECFLEVNGVTLGCGDDCDCASAALSAESICCPSP